MKHYLTTTVLFVAMVSCTNKESKDYEMLLNSMDMNKLRSYIVSYPDAPEEHITEITQRLTYLENDSAAFAAVEQGEDAFAKHSRAKVYLENFPQGQRVEEVKKIQQETEEEANRIMREEEAKLAEAQAQAEYEEKYGELCRKMENRYFRNRDGAEAIFTLPNRKGKGKAVINQLNTNFFFTYEAVNDKELHLQYNGTQAIQVWEIYDDDLYIYSSDGKLSIYHRNFLVPDEYQKVVKMINDRTKNM